MPERKTLEAILRECLKSGRCAIGSKSVLESLKSAKLVILSRSVPPHLEEKLASACSNNKTPVIRFQGSSVELAAICRKPFKVSAIAIRDPGGADLSPLLKEANSASKPI